MNQTINPSKKPEKSIQPEKTSNKDPIVALSAELVEESSEVVLSLEEDEKEMFNESTLPSTHHANQKKITPSNRLILQAQGGHEVIVLEDKAIVQERIQEPFRRKPLTLPIRKSPQVNLQHLAQQDKKKQERLVQVVFPEQVRSSKQQVESSINDPYQQGYVLIAEQGLKGGAPGMRLDVESLINTIVSGYSMVGKRPSTQEINNWRPFFNELASAMASLAIDFSPLHGPVSLSHLDPGNMKNSFEAISSRATGRNVRLENYGKAYIHIINQVREQIIQQQSINIDPAKYPSHSYEVYLKPSSDIFSMMALSQEVQKVYSISVNSMVNFDLGNALGVVEAEVRFNSSFGDFERREKEEKERIQRDRQEQERRERERQAREREERERQERERKEKESRQLDKRKEKTINEEIKLSNKEIERLRVSAIPDWQDYKKYKREWKDVNVPNTSTKFTTTQKSKEEESEEQESDEEEAKPAQPARSYFQFGKDISKNFISTIVAPRIPSFLNFNLGTRGRENNEDEEKVLTNPTGKGIRNDKGGDGYFGARRGGRKHMGIDFQCVYEQDIVSPIEGKAINSSFTDKRNIEIPTVVIWPKKQVIGFDKLELLYVGPVGGSDRSVKKGEVIGQSINLQSLGYSSNVGPHIHLQMKLNGEFINPTPYFPGLN